MAITVRPARPDDREAVKRMLGAFIDYLNAIEASGEAIDLDALVDLGFGPDPVCATMIAEQDGRPAGYVSYHPGVWEAFRALYVISFFVVAEARGAGVGRALMEAVKSIAREQGATRVIWEVWRKNPVAIDFYRAIGGVADDENIRMSLVVD